MPAPNSVYNPLLAVSCGGYKSWLGRGNLTTKRFESRNGSYTRTLVTILKYITLTKTNRIITISSLILSFIVVVAIIKGMRCIAYTYTIAKFHTGDGLGGSILTIQSNNTFIYESYLDISPNSILRGSWTRLNDTIVLNGIKCFRDDNGIIKNNQYCLEFENAKFIMYEDSLVHVSGKSSITFMRKYNE